MPETKVCTKCKVEKNIEEFYNSNYTKDGKRHWCKTCFNNWRKTPEQKEKNRKRDKKWKDNLTPEQRLLRKRKERASRRDKIREYEKRPYVKEKRKEYFNRPDIKENHKQYNSRPDQREKQKNHRQLPEVKQRKKELFKTPKYKAIHARVAHRRRCKIKDIECTLTLKQWEKIIELQGNKCVICGKRFTKKNPATKDHIIPVARSGPFTMENTQAVHKSCNMKKSAKIDKNNIVTWISRPDLCGIVL